MQGLELVLYRQLIYTKRILESRKLKSDGSLKTALFPEEQTANDLFQHALTTLYHYAFYNFNPKDGLPFEVIPINKSHSLSDQIIQQYDLAVKEFSRAINHISSEQYEKMKNGIGNLVMHCLTHVGQALRVQAINIRHFVKSVVIP